MGDILKIDLTGPFWGSVFFYAYDGGTDSVTQNQKGNTMWWWEDERRPSDDTRLKHIERKVDKIMATLEELNGLLGEIGSEVGKVAADTQSLLDKLAAIPTPGMTPEQQAALDAAVASATAIRDNLKSLDDKVPDATT